MNTMHYMLIYVPLNYTALWFTYKHISYLNGHSPPCMWWCCISLHCLVNDLPHITQLNAHSPLWMCCCFFKLLFLVNDLLNIIISIQPLAQFWQEPEPSQTTGMALARCIPGKFLGVVCHCFPLPLDVLTFATRCLHVPINVSAPSSERWNCGREWSGNFGEITPFNAI
jgi:hypothetical protein